MDPENLFYVALFVFWVLSQLSALAKKRRSKATPEPKKAKVSPRPAALPTAPAIPEQQARGVLEALSRLESRLDQSLSDLDERTRALATALIERDFRHGARRNREGLERALSQRDAGRLYGEIENTQVLIASAENILRSARQLSTARKTREMAQPLEVADRLLDEIYKPLSSFVETSLLETQGTPPPLAVVLDPAADDPIRTSLISRSTIFVPRSVSVDLLHWSLVTHEVTRWLSGLTPGIYQEIHEALSLSVTDADLATDREALTRLLFGAYLIRIVGDGVGACLFGPTYLRALARLYAEPDAPSKVTTIYLNQDGTVHPEPPAHLRVHATEVWLAEMGFATEAQEVVRIWDETHGHPSSFGFFRSTGSIPANAVLDTATDLMRELHQLELQRLAARSLPAIPGLADGAPRRREWSEAKASFLKGGRATGSARTLLAAAMDAVLEAPGAAIAIRNALYQSIAPGLSARKARTPLATHRASTPVGTSALRISARDVAEALILGDVLLSPRRF